VDGRFSAGCQIHNHLAVLTEDPLSCQEKINIVTSFAFAFNPTLLLNGSFQIE